MEPLPQNPSKSLVFKRSLGIVEGIFSYLFDIKGVLLLLDNSRYFNHNIYNRLWYDYNKYRKGESLGFLGIVTPKRKRLHLFCKYRGDKEGYYEY